MYVKTGAHIILSTLYKFEKSKQISKKNKHSKTTKSCLAINITPIKRERKKERKKIKIRREKPCFSISLR